MITNFFRIVLALEKVCTLRWDATHLQGTLITFHVVTDILFVQIYIVATIGHFLYVAWNKTL